MLVGYETITEDLTPFEETKALPLIVVGLRSKVGKANSITGTEIVRKINESGRLGSYKLNGPKLRKIISAIRLHYNVYGLRGVLSWSKGYYVAETSEEYKECLESLNQRLRQQSLIVGALYDQSILFTLNKRFDGEEKK